MATVEISLDEIPSVTEAQISAKITGLTPILQHRPGSMMAATGEVKKSSEKRIPTPEEECEAAVYRNEDGILYIPSQWIVRAMVESGKGFQNPQNRRATMMKPLAAALVPPPVLGFPLFDQESEEPIREYEIDIQRVVVQRNAVMRARPRIDSWEAFVNIGLDLAVLGGDLTGAAKLLSAVLAHAGSKQGLGDNRPERGGSYGRFQVSQFSVTDE